MLQLRHLFEGRLSRENVSSAILAMALESLPRFRRDFFNLVAPDQAAWLCAQKWNVNVEKDDVDVRMDADDIVILIENKIARDAKEEGQLLRYYLQEREKSAKRIITVYLAPAQMGIDEIECVKDHPDFRPGDLAEHVPWEDVISKCVPDEADPFDRIVGDGLRQVEQAIRKAQEEKYPPEGDRKIIRQIVDDAFKLLRERTTVPLSRWSGKDFEQILTLGTVVTVWLDAVFQAEDEPPFKPLNVRDAVGQIQLTIRSQIKLAGRITRGSELQKWWAQYVQAKTLDIPGIGTHSLRGKQWFVCEVPITDTAQSIATALAKTGEILVSTLSSLLLSVGFDIMAIK